MAESNLTKNARALSDVGAAILVSDSEARSILVDTALKALSDPEGLIQMSRNISRMALPGSDDRIVDEALNLIQS